jgi:hypothetical protein
MRLFATANAVCASVRRATVLLAARPISSIYSVLQTVELALPLDPAPPSVTGTGVAVAACRTPGAEVRLSVNRHHEADPSRAHVDDDGSAPTESRRCRWFLGSLALQTVAC